MKFVIYMIQDCSIEDNIVKKIIFQASALRDLGIDSKVHLIGDIRISSPVTSDFITVNDVKASNNSIVMKFFRARKIAKNFKRVIRSLGPHDFLYMRYPFPIIYCPIEIMKRMRRCKLISEHNTIEPNEYAIQKNYPGLITEFILGSVLRRQTSGIIGVTREIVSYQLMRSGGGKTPSKAIGNGVDVKSIPLRHPVPFNGDALHILCVANVSKWHGIDRFLHGLTEYHGPVKIIFHVVGTGPEVPNFKKFVFSFHLVENVIFHGHLTGAPLNDLFNICHLAIGSLGIHRTGLHQLSSLKTREYCARGVPFIFAGEDDDFPENFPYGLQIPADDSPVRIGELISFVGNVYSDTEYFMKMRHYAEDKVDWKIKMRHMKSFLEESFPDCQVSENY